MDSFFRRLVDHPAVCPRCYRPVVGPVRVRLFSVAPGFGAVYQMHHGYTDEATGAEKTCPAYFGEPLDTTTAPPATRAAPAAAVTAVTPRR